MTLASLVPNLALQTVPQALLIHTSTRPIELLLPPTSLSCPSVQFPAAVDSSEKKITFFITASFFQSRIIEIKAKKYLDSRLRQLVVMYK